MKYKNFLLPAVILLMVSGAVWNLVKDTQSRVPVAQRSPDLAAGGEQSSERMKEAVSELQDAKEADDAPGIYEATRKVAAEIGGRAGAMLLMAAGRNRPVHFFARVIDQYGQGVSGVRVDVVIAGGGDLAPGTGSTYFVSRDDGYLEIKGRGQDIGILRVRHPLLADAHFKHYSDGMMQDSLDLYATDIWGAEINWQSYDSKEKAYPLRVWRVSRFEKLREAGGNISVSVTGEARVFERIAVQCIRDSSDPNLVDNQQTGAWSITLAPENGGIQETEDLYLYEAPEGGYQKSITVSMARGQRIEHSIVRRYYYYTGEPKVYGNLSVTFLPWRQDNKCVVGLELSYGTTDSRNLAVQREN